VKYTATYCNASMTDRRVGSSNQYGVGPTRIVAAVLGLIGSLAAPAKNELRAAVQLTAIDSGLLAQRRSTGLTYETPSSRSPHCHRRA
jgi:hypothetical protein